MDDGKLGMGAGMGAGIDVVRAVRGVGPTASSARYSSIDTLRGFALLGILVPNIVSFAWPSSAYTDPSVISDAPANMTAYKITSIFFLGKFMFLFALLFGSGVVMYARKFDTADEDGAYHTGLATGAGLWYWRCAWLLIFGLVHAYFFWYGDILTYYAISGLTLLWWIRRLSPSLQLVGGFTLYLVATLVMTLMMISEIHGIDAGLTAIETTSLDPGIELAGYAGGWLDAFHARLPISLYMTFIAGPFMIPALWGIMAMGIALARTGILTGERSIRFYLVVGVVGLGVGLPGTVLAFDFTRRAFETAPGHAWETLAQVVGIPISIGYGALIIALSKWRPARFVSGALAAVGRMALTNYFLHTLLCTTFFYGYGLGYFASIEFPGLWLVALGVWSFNIIFSVLWLRFFTMGPFEWLWRCLSYRKRMPMRV